ncbi:MAG: VOC family protein [bacterium]|nr:VOC family protein [bacterium]
MFTLNAYLNFQGNAREAMRFYESVFGGTLTLHTFAQFNAVPEGHEAADQIMHAALEGPISLYAADHPEGLAPHPFVQGTNVNLALMGDNEEELRPWFDALSDGGQVVMPLQQQVWGDMYGAVVDRFGISWMFNISTADPASTLQEDPISEDGALEE